MELLRLIVQNVVIVGAALVLYLLISFVVISVVEWLGKVFGSPNMESTIGIIVLGILMLTIFVTILFYIIGVV